ncbi:MAG: PIG-L deacetylase family protein [Nitrosomonadaceae bacterium]
MKVLLLDPHPDDVALQCTGYILQHPEYEYRIEYFSDCENKDVVNEWRQYSNALGLEQVEHDFNRREFYMQQEDIIDSVYDSKKWEPDIIFAPSPDDPHQDHQVISRAAVAIYGKDKTILFYGNHNYNLKADTFCVFGDHVMNQKLFLLSYFESQKHRDYFDSDFIRSSHVFNKVDRYAERFKVYRQFV